jgi:hypothetical protein
MRMANYKNILLLFCLLSSLSQAQEIDSTKVPQAVRVKLWLIYPKATDVSWSRDCHTQTTTVNGVIVQRQLCYQAFRKDSGHLVIMNFDSTATWYNDWPHIKDNEPKNVPQQAKDKVASLVPPKMDITWQYSEEFDSAKYSADVFSEDTATDYNLYFDSAWHYLGQVINVYDDSALVPAPAINNYIRKHYRRATFLSADITKDAYGNITRVSVITKYKRRRRDYWSFLFNGKGDLLEPPTKIKARYIFGIDF